MNNGQLGVLVKAIADKAQLQTELQKKCNEIKNKVQAEIGIKVDDKTVKQVLKEQEKIQDRLGKTVQSRYKAERDLAEKQAKVINKHLDDEYKKRLKIEDHLAQVAQRRRQQELRDAEKQSKAINKHLENEYKKQQRFNNAGVFNAQKSIFSTQAYLNANPRIQKEKPEIYGQFQGIMSQLNTAKTTEDITKANAKLGALKAQVRAFGLEGRSVFGELANNMSKFAKWFFIGGAIASGVRTIKQMIDNVIRLNTEMTNLKKVTNESDATYNRFLDNASVKAKQLGTTISDLVASTAEFARLGYSLDEAFNLSQVANIYKVVGDLDIQSASQSLISTIKSFNIDTKDALSVIDKFNEVHKPAPLCLAA